MFCTYDEGETPPIISTRLDKIVDCSCGLMLLPSIVSTWLETIWTLDKMDFGVFCTTGLAETTRTTLDNCFVDFVTGLVGLISGFGVTVVDGGFVSITDVDDTGVSLVTIAFGNSAFS